jgi:low temperature requirement protein LtrA
LELFFDLVYVFAVTQLSHRLLDHLTIGNALETLLLLVVVWSAWISTTWVTNWFDPDRLAVRLMLIAVMLASLLMSVAIPEAFGERGLRSSMALLYSRVRGPTSPCGRSQLKSRCGWQSGGSCQAPTAESASLQARSQRLQASAHT